MLAEQLSYLNGLSLPLKVRLWDGREIDLSPNPEVTLSLRDPQVMQALQNPTLDNLGSAYVEGLVDLEGNLATVMALADQITRLNNWQQPDINRQSHDRETDAKAIAYHYNLSNDFYQLWLDPDMVYSCGYFRDDHWDLAKAQQDKLRHLCLKLRLKPGDYLLDVGCGWGGLSRYAAREFGVNVLGITLSESQLELARERVYAEGLEDRVKLELMDYRDLPQDGRFDKIVSVGMFEHVGHVNLPLYARTLYNAVRPGGLVMNHGITARNLDGRPVPRGGGDFIHRYVFPHGELPHVTTVSAQLADAGFEIADVESLRLHYARTLTMWSDNLEEKLAEAATMVSPQALRIWRIYLAGCAYAFQKGWIDIHQILCNKPTADGSTELPWSREDLYR